MAMDGCVEAASRKWYYTDMKGKHQRLLETMRRKPTPKTIPWLDIENLLASLGAEVHEGAGSAVSFRLKGERLALHRPHPRKEAKPYMVREVLAFLERTNALSE
jgi:hypothetical protein